MYFDELLLVMLGGLSARFLLVHVRTAYPFWSNTSRVFQGCGNTHEVSRYGWLQSGVHSCSLIMPSDHSIETGWMSFLIRGAMRV